MSDKDAVLKDLLCLFKKDYADPGALGFRQWLDLCKWLCDQGILFVLLEELQRIAPRPVIALSKPDQ